MKSLFAAIAMCVAAPASVAIEVKGLEIGSVVTEQALQRIFGSAKCEGRPTHVALPVSCTAPISYLGLKTSAQIFIDQRSSRAIQMTINVSFDKLADIERVLTARYGAPIQKRGAVRSVTLIDPKTKAETTSDYTEPCTSWKNVEGSDVTVCQAVPVLGLDSGRVTYSYSERKVLDPNDL